jgi:hypothetical protein
MSPFSGSPAFYGAVELQVHATGAAAVADLEAHVVALDAKIANLQSQLRSGAKTTVDATAELTKLAEQLRQAEEAAAAGNRVLAGQSAALDATRSSARGASQAVLEFSRGAEDFTTGGFLGALNNTGRMFGGIAQAAGLASPQVAAVEAATTLLATAAFAVWKNWDRIKDLLGDGLGPKLIDDIKSVEKALKELTDKEWKTRVDVMDINNAQAKLDELTKSKRAFDAMNSATDDQKARGEAVVDAVKNAAGPGGGGREAVLRGAIAATNSGDSPEVAEARKKLDELDRLIKEAEASFDITAEHAYKVQRQQLADSKEGRQGVEMLNRRQALADQLGAAGSGDEGQRRWLEDLVKAHSDKFKSQGIDTETFGSALGEASPQARKRSAEIDAAYQDAIEATDQSISDVKDRFKGIRKKERTDATEYGQRVNADAARVGPGFDDHLQKSIYDSIKGGKTPEAAMGAQRAGLIPALRARNVGEDAVSDVAQRLLSKAAESAQNLIAEGAKPRLDVKADQVAHHTKTEAEQAAHKLATERKHAVDQLAPEFMPQLEAGINANRLAQKTGDPSMRRENDVLNELQGEVANLLKQSGQNPTLAHEIVVKAVEDSNRKLSGALARTGNVVDALTQLVSASISQLDVANQRIAGQERRVAELQTKAAMGAMNQRRGATQGQSGLMSFGGPN